MPLRYHPLDLDVPYHSYGSRQRDPHRHCVPRSKAPHKPAPDILGWNLDYATAFLTNHIQTAHEAMRDLRHGLRLLRDDVGFHADIIHDTFHLLNRSLFADQLTHAVYLAWTPHLHHDERSAQTCAPGHRGVPRIAIYLNRLLYASARAEPSVLLTAVLEDLLHQMIHAFFLHACGAQDADQEPDGRLLHGRHFGAVLLALREACTRYRLYLRPRCGHILSGRMLHGYVVDRAGQSCGRNSVSCCSSDALPLSKDEVQAWFDKACRPLLDAPEPARQKMIFALEGEALVETAYQSSHAEDWVLVMYGACPIQIPRREVHEHASLQEGIGDALLWPVNENVPADVFKAFWEFLKGKSYEPEIAPAVPTQTSWYPGGPPFLPPGEPANASSPTSVLTDIRVYKLGQALNFFELKEYALDRLQQQLSPPWSTILELLTEIYDDANPYGGPPAADPTDYPPEDLRAFIRTWFRQPTPTPPHPRTWAYPQPNHTNLDTCLHHLPAFRALRARNTPLAEDALLADSLLIQQLIHTHQHRRRRCGGPLPPAAHPLYAPPAACHPHPHPLHRARTHHPDVPLTPALLRRAMEQECRAAVGDAGAPFTFPGPSGVGGMYAPPPIPVDAYPAFPCRSDDCPPPPPPLQQQQQQQNVYAGLGAEAYADLRRRCGCASLGVGVPGFPPGVEMLDPCAGLGGGCGCCWGGGGGYGGY